MKRLLCALLMVAMLAVFTAFTGYTEEPDPSEIYWFGGSERGSAAGCLCESCGKENDEEANFCPKCGSARPASGWICTGCGKANEVEDNFCPKCGTPRGENISDSHAEKELNIPEAYWGTWELFTVVRRSEGEYIESVYGDPDSGRCLLEISADSIKMKRFEDDAWHATDLTVGQRGDGDRYIQNVDACFPGTNATVLRLGEVHAGDAEFYYYLNAYDVEGPDHLCFARDSATDARENFLSRIWEAKYSYYPYDEFAEYFRTDQDAFIELKNGWIYYRDYEGVWRKFDVFSFELADKWQELSGENLYEKWDDYGQTSDGFAQYHGIPIGDRLSSRLSENGYTDDIGGWITSDCIFEDLSVYDNIYDVGLIRSEVHDWGEAYLELYQLRCYLDKNNVTVSSFDIYACFYLDEFGLDSEAYYYTEPSDVRVPGDAGTEHSSPIVDGSMNDVDFYAYYPDYEPAEGLASSGHINEDGSRTWWDYLRTSDTKTMYVYNCDEWVSLRAEADTDSIRIDRVAFGEPVSVYGAWRDWKLCEYRDRHGWIRQNYLSSAISTGTTETDNGRTETAGRRDTDGGEIGLLHKLWSDHYGYDLLDECGFDRAEATGQIDGVKTGSLLNWWLDSSGCGRSAISIPMQYAYEYEGVEINYGLAEITMRDSELYTTDYGSLEYYVLCFFDPETREVGYSLWRLYSEDDGGMEIGSIDMQDIYGDSFGAGKTAGMNDQTDDEIPARTGDRTGALIGTWDVDTDALMRSTGTDSAMKFVKGLLSLTDAGPFGGILDGFLGSVNSTMEFTEDGQYALTIGSSLGMWFGEDLSSTEEGTYYYDGERLEMDGEPVDFSLKEDELTIYSDGMSIQMKKR